MSGNCELGRGLRRREKNATEGGAGRFEKPAPDARAAPPEAHESLIGRKTVEEVPLTGLSLEEPLHAEPTHDTTAHLLGERGQIGLGDWPSRQLAPAGGPSPVGTKTPSVALGSQVHVVIDRRSEAVQKGDGTEPRTSRARPVAVTGRARRGTKQPLDLFDEDPREGRYRALAVSEKAAQSLRDGDRPLPHGHRGNDAVDEMRSCLRHSAAVARRTDTPALAREGHDKTLPARSTACPAEERDRLRQRIRLGGVETRRLLAEIDRRIAGLPLYRQ
jgi:hypothetical protein